LLFTPADFPDLLSGLAEADDAAVYKISDDLALIATLDFFTPIVDDPYDYGAIAAANAMSDVYAMGGDVIFALNIACFPKTMDDEVVRLILSGGAEKIREAGGALAGGHTIDDEEPKYGLAVLGTAHPARVWEKSGAIPGDLIVMTKRIGTGLITTALKGNAANPDHVATASASMKMLNRNAAVLGKNFSVHAATDITGFGLVGHAHEIARMSNVKMIFDSNSIPMLPGAAEYAGQFLFPGGTAQNRSAFDRVTDFDARIAEEMRMLYMTPETSGGLLLCLSEDDAHAYVSQASVQGLDAWIVGRIDSGAGIRIHPGSSPA
jgi:selenide, water dikinase